MSNTSVFVLRASHSCPHLLRRLSKTKAGILGFHQIATFAIGPCTHEILCEPLVVKSLFPAILWSSCNPMRLLKSNSTGLQNQMLWEKELFLFSKYCIFLPLQMLTLAGCSVLPAGRVRRFGLEQTHPGKLGEAS